jgi:transaldolase
MKTVLDDLRVKIFADGADLPGIRELALNPVIQGYTTNPTLMRQAGVTDYERFARDLLDSVPDKPVSFEVFSDDFEEMRRQARKIATWGANVYVKIPVTNTRGERSDRLLADLADAEVRVNVTAMFTVDQLEWVLKAIAGGPPSFVSIFAGRIADSGIDPLPIMRDALDRLDAYPEVALIWASPREVLNIVQASQIGCHIITVTHDLLKKMTSLGKDLDQFSLETVRMFTRDAETAGYSL